MKTKQGNKMLKVTKHEHHMFASTGMFGQYQYIYESPKGKISLIELTDGIHDHYPWEIMSMDKVDIGDDIKRFITKEEAVEAIEVYLL